MGKTIKLPNEAPPIYGKCHCGSDIFKLRLLHDGYTVSNLICAKCGDSEAVSWAEDADFDIVCDTD